jgi:NADP-dependent 3-hydroxy acid dehydrogenase YdfG
MSNIDGKVVAITGASSGIGEATALELIGRIRSRVRVLHQHARLPVHGRLHSAAVTPAAIS